MVYEANDLEGVSASLKETQNSKKVDLKALPLSKRVALQKEESDHTTEIKGQFGAKEVTYVPKSSRKKDTEERDKSGRRGQKRGIKELGLKRLPNF